MLRDLCGRLPYGVKCVDVDDDETIVSAIYKLHSFDIDDEELYGCVRPYLRPMSSMTEEEKAELCKICTLYKNDGYEFWGVEILNQSRYGTYFNYDYSAIEFLNAHHFDYRGLIEKGLALEAPEGMYNEKEK